MFLYIHYRSIKIFQYMSFSRYTQYIYIYIYIYCITQKTITYQGQLFYKQIIRIRYFFKITTELFQNDECIYKYTNNTVNESKH